MSLKKIETNAAPAPGGSYSQGLRAGQFFFTAGLGPINPETGAIVGSTIEEQTRQAMNNLQAILEAANMRFSNVVKTTVHLQNLREDFRGFDKIYQQYFSDPFPVRTTVGSTLNGFLIEIDLVALAD